jgi:uncharacterized protein (TIGR03437 family)
MRGLLALLVLPLLAQEADFRLTSVISGLGSLTDIQNAADGTGRLFLVQQNGLIRILRNGALVSQPFLDIRARTVAGGERGLLGLAFPQGFAGKQRFYVNYTDRNGNTVIAMYRVTADGDVADSASETVLLNIAQPFENHNGGQLRFGPDGYLYIGMGDGGSGGDPMGNGQNRNARLGKLLRLDVESQPGRAGIPPDNPFVNTAGTRPEIWALGLRNPWRFSFDRATGDLFIADVGQNLWEEVNFTPAASKGGENYGWNRMEGLVCYTAGCSTQGLTLPVAVYPHADGDCSVTGGFVYRGRISPGLRGAYIYADYCTGRIRVLRHESGQWVGGVVITSGLLITTFGEDEAGEIYAGTSAGAVLRVEGSRSPRIPASGTVNAASFSPGIVAGSLATAFVAGILDDTGIVSAPTLPLPTALSGVSVTVNGIPAPIHSIANTNGLEQVTFQTPFDAAANVNASVVVSRSGVSSAPASVPLLNVQPGVYSVVVHNADYSLVTGQRPLERNEFAFVYAAGLGPVSNPPAVGAAASATPLSMARENVRVTLGGIECQVPFAGLAPSFAGVYQVNFRVPANIPPGSHDIVVTAGDVSSPPIKAPVL